MACATDFRSEARAEARCYADYKGYNQSCATYGSQWGVSVPRSTSPSGRLPGLDHVEVRDLESLSLQQRASRSYTESSLSASLWCAGQNKHVMVDKKMV